MIAAVYFLENTPFKSCAIVGVHNDKSIFENVPFVRFEWVGLDLLRKIKFSFKMVCSNNLPLWWVLFDPHVMLWVLKSPTIINGFGNWFIIISKSDESKFEWFERYKLHKVNEKLCSTVLIIQEDA